MRASAKLIVQNTILISNLVSCPSSASVLVLPPSPLPTSFSSSLPQSASSNRYPCAVCVFFSLEELQKLTFGSDSRAFLCCISLGIFLFGTRIFEISISPSSTTPRNSGLAHCRRLNCLRLASSHCLHAAQIIILISQSRVWYSVPRSSTPLSIILPVRFWKETDSLSSPELN